MVKTEAEAVITVEAETDIAGTVSMKRPLTGSMNALALDHRRPLLWVNWTR